MKKATKNQPEPFNDFEIVDGVLLHYHGEDNHVVIPEGVITIGKDAFNNCITIRKVIVTAGVKNIDEILLLQDGHCFRDGILNLCKNSGVTSGNSFQLESGSFETLVKLANEGLGTTLLPFLHTLDLNEKDKQHLHHFVEPKPAREVSLIFPKTELKIHIIDALRNTISGVVKGAIAFHNIQIISPLSKK